MPPLYGYSITPDLLNSDFIATYEASTFRREMPIYIFLLMIKHNDSIAIQGPVDKHDYFKEHVI